jgi:hypothetical protein
MCTCEIYNDYTWIALSKYNAFLYICVFVGFSAVASLNRLGQRAVIFDERCAILSRLSVPRCQPLGGHAMFASVGRLSTAWNELSCSESWEGSIAKIDYYTIGSRCATSRARD